MDIDIERLFQPLAIVDNETIGKMGEKLQKSRKREEQAIGSFLMRVSVMRTEGQGGQKKGARSDINHNHGLRHLSD